MGNKEDSKKFRSFALAFLKEAKEDLESADELLEKKKYSRVVFFCQQAVEKSVKALLEMEKIFIAEHDLSTFFVRFIYNNKRYNDIKKNLNNILEILDYFDGEWSKTRYPKEKKGKVVAPTEIYGKDDAEEAYKKANEAYDFIYEILIKKFNFKEEYNEKRYREKEENDKKEGNEKSR